MIEDTLAKIESAIRKIEAADKGKKAELLRLLGELKREMRSLEGSADEGAGSVAGFADAAAYEATRRAPSPALTRLALDALAASAKDFETSHPALTRVVNEICRELASLGI